MNYDLLTLKSFLGVIFLKQHFYSSSWYQIGDGAEWDKAKTRYVYAVQSAESGKWKNAYLSTNILPRRIIWERIWQDSRLIKTGSVSTELQSWSGKSTLSSTIYVYVVYERTFVLCTNHNKCAKHTYGNGWTIERDFNLVKNFLFEKDWSILHEVRYVRVGFYSYTLFGFFSWLFSAQNCDHPLDYS